jgi:hypothetical protein
MTGLLPPEIGRSALGLALVSIRKAYVFINFQMEILAICYMFGDNATKFANKPQVPIDSFCFPSNMYTYNVMAYARRREYYIG